MTERSTDRTDGADPGYRPDMPEFGDAESGGLAAEPGDTPDADRTDASRQGTDRDEVPGGSGDLAGTPTGDLGPGTAEDVAQDRDIDRDLGASPPP